MAQIISWNGRQLSFPGHNFGHWQITSQITGNLTTWAQSKAHSRILKLGSTGSPMNRGYNSIPTLRSRSRTGITLRFTMIGYSYGVGRTPRPQTRDTTVFLVRIIGNWWGFLSSMEFEDALLINLHRPMISFGLWSLPLRQARYGCHREKIQGHGTSRLGYPHCLIH